ncbi:MAG: PrpF domain-containing protein [Devosia sp.]|nr:PrpF domain-containing protein [Devosia sp.]
MKSSAIPFLFLRGGTSRGPYFLRRDLPQDRQALAETLLAIIGSGSTGNVDGLGGGIAVTCKVAMLSPSESDWADVDYFFAQVIPEEGQVDFAPTCGNILAGVGPAAIEMGLVKATPGRTRVRIRAVNTNTLVEASVPTPGGEVQYALPIRMGGTAEPILLDFMRVTGAKTGRLLPTGAPRDSIGGIEVSCIDAAMPMVLARADSLGVTGYESKAELDANRDLFTHIEPIRLEAARRMGMGDATRSVVPKFGLLAPARNGGTICSRYFMPWDCHPSHAVTGGICVTAALLLPGSITADLLKAPLSPPRASVVIEHPSGSLKLQAEFTLDGATLDLKCIGTTRTARKLAAGNVFVSIP